MGRVRSPRLIELTGRLRRMTLASLLVGALCGLGAVGVLAGSQERGRVGTRVVFIAGRQCPEDRACSHPRDVVRSISPHGGHARELAEIRSVVEMSATEDGKWVAILSKIVAGGGAHAAPFTQVYLLSPNGSLTEVFDRRIEGFNATGLAISRDGRLLALAGRGRGMQGFPREHKIFVVRPNGSDTRQLTTGAGRDDAPAFSPSGKRVVFQRSSDGGPPATRDAELYVVGIGGGGGTRLTNNAADDVNPVFSPNGKNIAFGQVPPRGPNKVAAARADGTGIRTVAGTGREFPDPDYSPNGRNLAYIGELKAPGGGFVTGIFTVRATGASKKLASKAFSFAALPQWTEQP